MQHNNPRKKVLLSNNSLAKTILLLRDSRGSLFHGLPKDITNQMIGITRKLSLPNQTYFESLASELLNICENYKNNFKYFKNTHHKIACKTEEFVKLLMTDTSIDEKRALYYLIPFHNALNAYMKTEKSIKFLKMLKDLDENHELINGSINLHNSVNLVEEYRAGRHMPLYELLIYISNSTKNLEGFIRTQYLRSDNLNPKNLLNELEYYYNKRASKKDFTEESAALDTEIQHHLDQTFDQPAPFEPASLNQC